MNSPSALSARIVEVLAMRCNDRRLGAVPVPVAAVELSSGAPVVTPDELAAYLAGQVARYELPTEIRVVDALPRTDSGKADLAALAVLVNAVGGD
jgi:acyl-CoA synthetase (AMP-forming)/AMP-acid ligase II